MPIKHKQQLVRAAIYVLETKQKKRIMVFEFI